MLLETTQAPSSSSGQQIHIQHNWYYDGDPHLWIWITHLVSGGTFTLSDQEVLCTHEQEGCSWWDHKARKMSHPYLATARRSMRVSCNIGPLSKWYRVTRRDASCHVSVRWKYDQYCHAPERSSGWSSDQGTVQLEILVMILPFWCHN